MSMYGSCWQVDLFLLYSACFQCLCSLVLIKRHFFFLPAFGLPSYTCRIWEVALAYVINAILMSETDILTLRRKWLIGFKQGIIAVVVEGDPIHRTKEYHRLKRVFCFLTFTFLVVSKIPCDCQRDSERNDGSGMVAFSSIIYPSKTVFQRFKKKFLGCMKKQNSFN